MRDSDPKIVESFEIPSSQESLNETWHRCVVCKEKWRPQTPARHHDRCGIGNLQKIVTRLNSRLVHEADRAAGLRQSLRGEDNDRLGLWQTWAHGLLGRVAKDGSDVALRYRLEERMRPDASTVERGLRLEIADLQGKLEEERVKLRRSEMMREYLISAGLTEVSRDPET